MTEQEIQALVMLVRRAPLANMAEAEAVSQLLDKTILTLRQAAQMEASRVDDHSVVSTGVAAGDHPGGSE